MRAKSYSFSSSERLSSAITRPCSAEMAEASSDAAPPAFFSTRQLYVSTPAVTTMAPNATYWMAARFLRSHFIVPDVARASASSTISPGSRPELTWASRSAACSRRRRSSSFARAFLSLGRSSSSTGVGAAAAPAAFLRRRLTASSRRREARFAGPESIPAVSPPSATAASPPSSSSTPRACATREAAASSPSVPSPAASSSRPASSSSRPGSLVRSSPSSPSSGSRTSTPRASRSFVDSWFGTRRTLAASPAASMQRSGQGPQNDALRAKGPPPRSGSTARAAAGGSRR